MKKPMKNKYQILVFIAFMLPSCMTASEHREAVREESGDRVTVGTVQREIKIGMAGSEVVRVLGSPNVVTTDEQRREIWIYDKFSSESTASESSGFGTLIILGASRSANSISSSQRTLTVIIKFGHEKKVRDFAYRTSRF